MTSVRPGIVTPEAVPLDFEDAGVGTRAAALLIDWSLQATAVFLLALAATFVFGLGGAAVGEVAAIIVALLGTFLIVFGYPIGFEVAWRGRTPGKAALGLRVVTLEGAPVGFRHAAIRAALGLVDFAATSGFAAVLTVLLSRRSQRIGDHVAGTVVVRERVADGPADALTFTVPHGWEAYADTIDVSGLGSGDYRTLRAFLQRVPSLPPARVAALGERLAAVVADRLAHTRPPGIDAVTFLTCVAARVQQRGTPAASPPPPVSGSPPAGSPVSGSPPAGSPASGPPPAGSAGGFAAIE